MESLTFRTGQDARLGGVDITISLRPEEVAALGGEAGVLADRFDTALWALVALRTGHTFRRGGAEPLSARDLYTVLVDLDTKLLPRLEGVRDAAIRRHKELGGSVGDLALAMDAPRSTAQSRREALEKRGVSAWEDWATSGGPDRAAYEAENTDMPRDPVELEERIAEDHADMDDNGKS